MGETKKKTFRFNRSVIERTAVITVLIVVLVLAIFAIVKYNQYINDPDDNGNVIGLINVTIGFLGAIIGGLLSLLGIAWTIEFTSQQNKEDRELQIRPYFDIQSSSMRTNHENDHFLGFIRLFIEDQEVYNEMKTGDTKLIISNVGLGTAIQLNFHVSVSHISAKHNECFTNGNLLVDANAIATGNSGIVEIQLYNKVPEITTEDRCWNDNLKAYTYEKALSKLPKDFSFSIIIEYQDLLTNWFTQKLDYNVHYVLDDNKICGNMTLLGICPPTRKEEDNI